jgi:hypothetical protein
MTNTCMSIMKKATKTRMVTKRNKQNMIQVSTIIINLPSLLLRKSTFQGEKLLMRTPWILHLLMALGREILLQKLFKNVLLNNFKMKKCRNLKKLRNLVYNQVAYLQTKLAKNIKNNNKELINLLFMNRNLITIKNFGDYFYRTRILLPTLTKYPHQIIKQSERYLI